MFYEVRARFFFDVEDEAVDFFNDCRTAKPKTISANTGSPNSEISYAHLIENNHDLEPTEPCNIIDSL